MKLSEINNIFLKFFNKHHGQFNIVCKTEGELYIRFCLLNYKYFHFIHSGQPITSVVIVMEITRQFLFSVRKKNTKNKRLSQLVIRLLLVTALADQYLGDSALLLYFSESRTRT